jgi:hypothetical protein
VQENGSKETAFVYVWHEKYRNALEEVPWDFDNFMKHDFVSYWSEEMEDAYPV